MRPHLFLVPCPRLTFIPKPTVSRPRHSAHYNTNSMKPFERAIINLSRVIRDMDEQAEYSYGLLVADIKQSLITEILLTACTGE